MLVSSGRLTQEIVHHLQVVPVAWLGLLWLRSRVQSTRPIEPRLWGLALAYLVGWAADWISFAHLPSNITVGNFYPLVQGTLLGALLLSRRGSARRVGKLVQLEDDLAAFMYALLLTAAVVIRWPSPIDTDVLLRTVAWLSVAYLGCRKPDFNLLLRLSFFFSYGVGWASWMVYLCVRAVYMTPTGWTGGWVATWVPYLTYQGFYLVGALLFCAGALLHVLQPQQLPYLAQPSRQNFSLKL